MLSPRKFASPRLGGAILHTEQRQLQNNSSSLLPVSSSMSAFRNKNGVPSGSVSHAAVPTNQTIPGGTLDTPKKTTSIDAELIREIYRVSE